MVVRTAPHLVARTRGHTVGTQSVGSVCEFRARTPMSRRRTPTRLAPTTPYSKTDHPIPVSALSPPEAPRYNQNPRSMHVYMA